MPEVGTKQRAARDNVVVFETSTRIQLFGRFRVRIDGISTE